jgi:hypothetical protein
MGKRAPSALLALACLTAAGAARAEADDATGNEHYSLRAELGLEVDTNAHRTEIVTGADNPPLVTSPVERLVVAGTLSDVIADGQAVMMSATAAGKLFDAPAARDENVAIAQSSLAWQEALGGSKTLTLSGAYYEAFQAQSTNLVDASERRDFRSLAPSAQLAFAPAERWDLALGLGYRSFEFKPDRDDDFTAPTATLESRWLPVGAGTADWEVSAGAAFEDRTFGGPALTNNCAGTTQAIFACSGPDTRHDQFLMTHLDLTRVGQVLTGVGYAFHDNRSNSYGETVLRHFFTARFAAPLPGGLTLAARAELLLAFYSQPVVIGQIQPGSFSSVESIDDENRSSLRVDLSRALGDRLRVVMRYTFYANEIANAAPISYRRQTLLLSLAGLLEK